MKKQFAMAILVLACAVPGKTYGAAPQAAAPAKDQKATFASVLDRQFTGVEKEVVPAAEAMPDDKFDFAPDPKLGSFDKVRTFALQVKHIAVANYMLAGGILAEKPAACMCTDENGPANVKTKADVIKYLHDSFTYAHTAINSINESNILESVPSPFGPNKTTRLGLAIGLISHPLDHYGQMVEYLRMNSIIPPASRPQPK